MSIVVTQAQVENVFDTVEPGVHFAAGVLAISGLSEGPNTIPHGNPTAPSSVSFRPGAGGKWGETQRPDEINFYITVGSGGATEGRIDYTRRVA
jgi:hypothetical protein